MCPTYMWCFVGKYWYVRRTHEEARSVAARFMYSSTGNIFYVPLEQGPPTKRSILSLNLPQLRIPHEQLLWRIHWPIREERRQHGEGTGGSAEAPAPSTAPLRGYPADSSGPGYHTERHDRSWPDGTIRPADLNWLWLSASCRPRAERFRSSPRGGRRWPWRLWCCTGCCPSRRTPYSR